MLLSSSPALACSSAGQADLAAGRFTHAGDGVVHPKVSSVAVPARSRQTSMSLSARIGKAKKNTVCPALAVYSPALRSEKEMVRMVMTARIRAAKAGQLV